MITNIVNGVEGIDYVVCQICGKRMTKIDQKHLKFHNTTYDEYREKYGADSTMCKKLKDSYASGKKNTSNREEFIKKAREVHKDENLDYSNVDYVNNRTKVCIIDPEYGEFWQTPSNHLKGQGHPSRRAKRISETKQFTTEQVIEMFKKAHPNENLDYSQVEYKGMHVPVKIICRELDANDNEYGEFWQEPNSHIHGHTHKRYASDKQGEERRDTTESFISKWKKKFPNEIEHYSFDKVVYQSSQKKIIVTCNKIGRNGKPHGDFEINPDAFLQGKGCPKCANQQSKAENEIYEYVSKIVGKENVIQRNRTILKPYELDIYVPSKNFAVEYNGITWHSDKVRKIDKNYHLNKTIKCNEQGITLFQIFEDEYMKHKGLVLDKIANALEANHNKPAIMARKCTVREIDNESAKSFLGQYHIQGYVVSTLHLGAFHNDELIAVMSFKCETKESNDWNLTRFATNINYRCQGIAGKIFSHFVKEYNPDTVKSFLDRRWINVNKPTMYDNLGFVIDKIEAPDYKYTKNGFERFHKFGFRKQVLNKKYGLPLTMTEKEMTEELGYYRIYDCGLIKYIWKNGNQG